MTRTLHVALAGAIALTSMACASTNFISTWKAPDATPFQSGGAKVVALVMNTNEAARRAAEDALARELTRQGAVGVPMYSILASGTPASEAEARSAVEKAGAAGVVVLRPIGTDKEVSSVPVTTYVGPTYRGFWGGYYGYGWGAPYGMAVTQQAIRTDTIVSVETLVYSLSQNRLVWAGRSKTTNPSKVDNLVKDVVSAAVRELKRQKLL